MTRVSLFTLSFPSQLARPCPRLAAAAPVCNARRARTTASTTYTDWEHKKSRRALEVWFPTSQNFRDRTLVGWWNSVHLPIHPLSIPLTQYTICRARVALHAPILFSTLYLVDPVIVATFLHRHQMEQDHLALRSVTRNTWWESR